MVIRPSRARRVGLSRRRTTPGSVATCLFVLQLVSVSVFLPERPTPNAQRPTSNVGARIIRCEDRGILHRSSEASLYLFLFFVTLTYALSPLLSSRDPHSPRHQARLLREKPHGGRREVRHAPVFRRQDLEVCPTFYGNRLRIGSRRDHRAGTRTHISILT